jgi:DNA-binding beta-propeller fold protein YncE
VRTFAADDLAHDVGFTPDGSHVWISSGVDRRLAIHDGRSLKPLRAVPGDAAPQHVTFDPLAGHVYVASGDSGTLRTHSPADGRLLRTRRVTTGSYNVCALTGRVVTPSLDDGRLTLLDARGLRSVHVAAHAHDACIVVI